MSAPDENVAKTTETLEPSDCTKNSVENFKLDHYIA